MRRKALKREAGKRHRPPKGSTAQSFSVPAISVAIANRQRTKTINRRFLRRITAALLHELGIETAELGINIVDAREMARVNRQFLQHEGSTDVITFDHRQLEAENSKPWILMHGELFVCVDDAVAQAAEFRATWQAEVIRYVVHGVLHLTGHDDLKPNLRRKMKREENRLMRRLAKDFAFANL